VVKFTSLKTSILDDTVKDGSNILLSLNLKIKISFY